MFSKNKPSLSFYDNIKSIQHHATCTNNIPVQYYTYTLHINHAHTQKHVLRDDHHNKTPALNVEGPHIPGRLHFNEFEAVAKDHLS